MIYKSEVGNEPHKSYDMWIKFQTIHKAPLSSTHILLFLYITFAWWILIVSTYIKDGKQTEVMY